MRIVGEHRPGVSLVPGDSLVPGVWLLLGVSLVPGVDDAVGERVRRRVVLVHRAAAA